MKKNIIAVIGYANIDNIDYCNNISKLAFDLGRLIVDNGYILANGGLGGVMEMASKGARESHLYNGFSIIGILPNYDKNISNTYIDIPLASGFDVGRNLSLVSMADAVIAIGGGAGTLSEISLAWQLGKLIISLGDFGWAGKLANRSLDDRRDDVIYSADSPEDALDIIKEKINDYSNKKFTGISPSISISEARKRISDYFNINECELEYLGKGKEGIVFTDKKNVYKIIKNPQYYFKYYIHFHFITISNKIKNMKCDLLYPFEVFYNDRDLIIYYKYKPSKKINDKSLNLKIEDFQELLNKYYFSDLVYTGLRPENILCYDNGELFICDIGYDMQYLTEEFFYSMCRRAFAIYKLLPYLDSIKNIKEYLSPLNNEDNFQKLEHYLKSDSLKDEYNSFLKGIGKFSIQRMAIIDFYKSRENIRTIFDYGSGYALIARILQNKLNKKVYAYEIDKDIIEKYKNNYNSLEDFGSDAYYINDLIKRGIKFDSVLCSLVLCHPLASDEDERLKIIDDIMNNIVNLSNSHILIVICNPLFNNAVSNIQKRLINNNDFYYSDSLSFHKSINSSGRIREDIHRPIGFYESLFKRFNLKIKNVIQTGDFIDNKYIVNNSDFILFDLLKN